MKSLQIIFTIISLVTISTLEDFNLLFCFLVLTNLLLFIFFINSGFLKNNIVVLSFYITYILAYVIKLELFTVLFTNEYSPIISTEIFTLTTISHFFIVFFLLFYSFSFNFPEINKEYASTGVLSSKESIIIKLSFILILSTSYIYFVFDLFVMGKEMVVLPFHLNGLLFYLRTMILPVILLTVLFTSKNKKNSLYTIILLLFLGVTDMILRGSKGALIYIIIQIFIVVSIKSNHLKRKINYKPFIIILLLIISIYPLMDNYRSQKISGESNSNELAISNTPIELITKGTVGILKRFLGFSEFYYIYNKTKTDNTSIEFEDNISSTYTHNFLNLPKDMIHLSSPSLLGIAYIFFGAFGVFFVFIFYLLIFFIIFKIYSLTLTITQIPVLAYTVFEIMNSTIAGTIDFSINSLAIGYLIMLSLEKTILKNKL